MFNQNKQANSVKKIDYITSNSQRLKVRLVLL